MSALAVYEDTSQLPRCPRCYADVKMRRCGAKWVLYEVPPMNRFFVGNYPDALIFEKEFVFIPHALCCGVSDCPSDPVLMQIWERNRDQLERAAKQKEHPIYGPVYSMTIKEVAERLHTRLVNSRGLALSRAEAVAIVDYLRDNGVFSEAPLAIVPVLNQCSAMSSTTGHRCRQKVSPGTLRCYAHPEEEMAVSA